MKNAVYVRLDTGVHELPEDISRQLDILVSGEKRSYSSTTGKTYIIERRKGNGISCMVSIFRESEMPELVDPEYPEIDVLVGKIMESPPTHRIVFHQHSDEMERQNWALVVSYALYNQISSSDIPCVYTRNGHIITQSILDNA